jgi:hypothetical protein
MDQEIAPDEAGIETDRIRAKQVESLQTRKHPSALADEHKPVVGERLGKSFETTPHKDEIETARIQAEQGESFRRGNIPIILGFIDIVLPSRDVYDAKSFKPCPGSELEFAAFLD